MGVLLREPELDPGEIVLWSVPAGRTHGRAVVGGRLFVTSERVCFVARRLAQAVRRSPDVEIPRSDIAAVGIEPPGSAVSFDGSEFSRVRIDRRVGDSEYVVVSRHIEVADALRSALGMGGQDGVAATPPPSAGPLASVLPWPFWAVVAVMSSWFAARQAVEVVNGDGVGRVVAAVVGAVWLAMAVVCVVHLVARVRTVSSSRRPN